jgi:tetratricopeptide (TPR) repeat protein
MPALTRESLDRDIGWRSGIGSAHDDLGQVAPDAQRYFDQGLAFLHNYVWIDAERSFHQAERLVSDQPLILVALSYAYDGLDMHSAAREVVARARSLSPRDPHVQAHLIVRERELVAQDGGTDAAMAAYRAALDQMLTRFPADLELWLLRGLAESPHAGDRGQSSVPGAVRFYQHVASVAPDHVAAHHYLAHAFENSGNASGAAAEAARYAALAPAIPHAHHMQGHNLRRAGRISEAIAEFETADRLQRSYFDAEHVLPETDWHYEHNLDLLGTSYQYVGKIRRASELLRAAFDLPTANLIQAVNKRQWPLLLRLLGRTDDALRAARVLATHPHPVVQAAGHLEIAHVLLLQGQVPAAAAEASATRALLQTAGAPGVMLAPSMGLLQGELELRQGQRQQGEANIRRSIAAARALRGPDEWAEALFMMESAALSARSAGAWDLARDIANQMLQHDRFYGGSHFAAALAASHDGDAARAASLYDEARRLWAGADADFPPSVAIARALAANR